jgi:predicted 2-oxoglutarate/Fe(II)-dependent dioxygenase YbiX
MSVNMGIVIREGFLAPDEVAQLLNGARTITTWDAHSQGYWKSRVAHAAGLNDPKLSEKLIDIRKRVGADITEAFALTEPIYADTLQIVRWPEGFEQQPHADSENPNGVPHEFHWRRYASLIYLNDDFEGGQIYFPKLNLTPTIKPGMLVYFPGTLEYLHGVSKVTRGVRFTVVSFWTFDRTKWDGLPI